jgi:hypothetical protein
METEYVAFSPPRVAAVKMTRGPRILAAFGGTWEFAPLAGGTTKVTFRYQLRTRPRWLAWLLEPLARWWFWWETRRRVEALAKALRSQPVPSRIASQLVVLGYIAPTRVFERPF